jgi:hypothetical protein
LKGGARVDTTGLARKLTQCVKESRLIQTPTPIFFRICEDEDQKAGKFQLLRDRTSPLGASFNMFGNKAANVFRVSVQY